MPLLFVDLDNTISDRAASLRRWAVEYLTERFGEASDEMVEAMVVADGDGLTSKVKAAAAYAEVLGLDEDEQANIITVMRAGTLEHLEASPGITEALDRAAAAGYMVIVTNGKVSQQAAKVAKLGAWRITSLAWWSARAWGSPSPIPIRLPDRGLRGGPDAGGSLDDR